jgi:hypothetical protein
MDGTEIAPDVTSAGVAPDQTSAGVSPNDGYSIQGVGYAVSALARFPID